jgi:hypothetical protein
VLGALAEQQPVGGLASKLAAGAGASHDAKGKEATRQDPLLLEHPSAGSTRRSGLHDELLAVGHFWVLGFQP